MARTDRPVQAVERQSAVAHLMALLAVEGLSGREGQASALVQARLRQIGVPARAIHRDRVYKKFPYTAEVGNLIVRLPGTSVGPRRLLMAHLDQVPICAGAEPVQRGNRIVPRGNTGLGADDRTGCATLLTALETILRRKLSHPPLTVLFTVGEEVGMWGARLVSLRDLGRPALAFNFDDADPNIVVTGAIGTERWTAEIAGIASHAGVAPELGVSAIAIAAQAIAAVKKEGWFGIVTKGRQRGLSNVGRIQGGQATNEVTARAVVHGEARSHDHRFARRIAAAYRAAFDRTAAGIENLDGRRGQVTFTSAQDYPPYVLSKSGAEGSVVRLAEAAVRACGGSPRRKIENCGFDANYLAQRGIPTVTLGCGQHYPHALREYVDLAQYLQGCRLAVAVATLADG